jgi:hypothetical protein
VIHGACSIQLSGLEGSTVTGYWVAVPRGLPPLRPNTTAPHELLRG